MDRMRRFKKEMIDLYSEVDLRQLLEKITAAIRGYLSCEEASIFIYDEEREELSFETATGAQAEELKRIVLRRGEGVAGWIAAEDRGLLLQQARYNARVAAIDANGLEGRPRTYAFERRVMGLRRQRHDEVEIVVLQLVQRMGRMAAERQADLSQHRIDEGVAFAGADAGGGDIGARRQKAARQRLGHRRAHGIHAAHEEDRTGRSRRGFLQSGGNALHPLTRASRERRRA